MIDLIVMRAEQRVCCGDVQVMKEATCWTDHKLVRAKLRMGVPHACCKSEKRMKCFSAQKLSSSYARGLQESFERVFWKWNPIHCSLDFSSEENWKVLKPCIKSGAEEIIGQGKRKQSEWFEENDVVLMPLIDTKMMHTRGSWQPTQ